MLFVRRIFDLLVVYTTVYLVINQLRVIEGHEGTERNKVAVCVSGQTARWLPTHLLEGLLKNNPSYSFFLFFNMQYAERKEDIVYNTDQANAFSTSMGKMKKMEIKRFLHELYATSHNVEIASLQFHTFTNGSQLLTMMQEKDQELSIYPFLSKKDREGKENNDTRCTKLDRISQYTTAQDSILNMYLHQMRCVEQILLYESNHRISFDFIIPTREDLYFFQPLHLPTIVKYLRNNAKSGSTGDSITPLHNHYPWNNITYPPQSCDIPYKRCLNFWGLNMRLYVLTRDVGLRLLGNRFAYYRFLCKMDITVENPERFELTQANALQFVSCGLAVDLLPVTAIRTYAFTSQLFEEELITTKGKLNWLQNGVYGVSSGVTKPVQSTLPTRKDKVATTKDASKAMAAKTTLTASSASTSASSSSSPAKSRSLLASTPSVSTINTTKTEDTKGDDFCFIWFEVDRCVPQSQQNFVKSKLCIDMRRAAYVEYLKSINATRFNRLIDGMDAKEDDNDIAYKYHLKYFNRSFDFSRLPLDESVKRRPLSFQPQVSFDHTSALYQGIAPTELVKYLKKKKKFHSLQRLSVDENFSKTFWNSRDYW